MSIFNPDRLLHYNITYKDLQKQNLSKNHLNLEKYNAMYETIKKRDFFY